jgi:hypothetical protein
MYWLLSTSVRKIANFAFSPNLCTWHMKLDKGKSMDVLLTILEKQPQADEKNRRLLGERALKSHTQDDLRAPTGISAQCKGIVIHLDHPMYC